MLYKVSVLDVLIGYEPESRQYFLETIYSDGSSQKFAFGSLTYVRVQLKHELEKVEQMRQLELAYGF